jgi:hypothetical protein
MAPMSASETLMPDAEAVLTVVVNGQPALQYDRRKPLAARQRLFLDHMDRDMDAGITLNGERIGEPDLPTRARFVAISLLDALDAGNDGLVAATCAYLALRLPELKQVKLDRHQGQTRLDLVFDQDYVPTQTLQFIKPGGPGKPH